MTNAAPCRFRLSSSQETTTFAENLAKSLRPGDTILLFGGLGAGKTHFARSIIQYRLAKAGRVEDVPSPTFTLVQTYDDGQVEIWHADLYRLTHPDDVWELGLDGAFETAICLIEWPERLGNDTPDDALSMAFQMTETRGERLVDLSWNSDRWTGIVGALNGGSTG